MRWFLVFIICALLCAGPSAACSVNESYKQPTNFELVQKADVVVLARIGAVPPAWKEGEEGRQPGSVTIEPIRFLKGNARASDLALMGWRPPKNWEGTPTATTLWQSHFSAGLGACIRQFYQPGELVVAIFKNDPKAKEITGRELNQIFDPWARVVETVDTPEDIWVHEVERYVQLQSGNPATLKPRIEADIRLLRAQPTPEAQAIAADLEFHLRRGDRAATWGSFSLPTFAGAMVAGERGANLYCVAGTPPGLMLVSSQARQAPQLVIDGARYTTTLARLSPAEQWMVNDTAGRPMAEGSKSQPPNIYRLSHRGTLDALRAASKSVAIELDGKPIISGQPLDALFRWAGQCDKLQKLPMAAEGELPRSHM